jgi:hypothetical protein
MSPRARRVLAVAIAAFGAALLLAFSFAPHYCAWAMKRAADANDERAFAARVDLQSVRESLKAARHEPGPITRGLAGRLASRIRRLTFGAFTDRLIDRLVTHERLMRAIRGEGGGNGRGSQRSAAGTDAERRLDLAMRYETPNRFAITVRDPAAAGEPVVLVFARRGVFAWQLAAIRM